MLVEATSLPTKGAVLSLVAAVACSLACASALSASGNQTYLIEVLIRRRYGFTLGCYDNLHRRDGRDFASLEESVCAVLRKASSAAKGAYGVQQCRADRFLCDQNLPLAQIALTVLTSNPSPIAMADLRLRFRAAASEDEHELQVDRVQIMDYNECESALLNDCSLNAICQNRPGGYACLCKAAFVDRSPVGGSGKVCVSRCGPAYCENGGQCAVASTGICSCPAGYSGDFCEARAEAKRESNLVAVVPYGSDTALVMALCSLTLTLIAALCFGFWVFARRRGFPNLKAGSTLSPSAYHELLATGDADVYSKLTGR